MDTQRTLNRSQVAAELQRSPDWFSRHWRKLVAAHGLPEPLPGPGHKRWSAEAINAYTGKQNSIEDPTNRAGRLARRAQKIGQEISPNG